MSLPKQKFREIVLQCLFASGFSLPDAEGFSFYTENFKTTKKNLEPAFQQVRDILTRADEIDAWIRKTSLGFDLERIHRVELNILRLMIHESLTDHARTSEILIAEVFRLTKKFETNESLGYVHAVLDRIHHEKLASSEPVTL